MGIERREFAPPRRVRPLARPTTAGSSVGEQVMRMARIVLEKASPHWFEWVNSRRMTR